MDTDAIRLFCDIAVTKNITRAAKLNKLSQGAASKIICDLEEELGVRLIDCSRRPFELTPAGVQFHEDIRPVLARFDDIVAGPPARPRGRARGGGGGPGCFVGGGGGG